MTEEVSKRKGGSLRCPKCGGELLARHTLPAGRHAQAREYKCLDCGTHQTSVTFLVKDRDESGGARMQIKKIKNGKLKIEEFYTDGN